VKKLLHVCCANCLSDVVDAVAGEGDEVVLLFANPNIHPLVEFRRRRKSVRLLAERLGLALEEDPYGLFEFLEAVKSSWREGDGGARCRACYRLRLGRAAERAKEIGADAFTTTLLVSREQDREGVVEAGSAAARQWGVSLEAPDLREFHGSDAARPKDLKLYKQGYCGCVFSEEERFRDSTRGD
jgi:predicted adenine nucleotide alpha hydrolase (AANH) superfamily ATPase